MFISFRYSYVLTLVKKDKMVRCGAPWCTNPAEKESIIITAVKLNNVLHDFRVSTAIRLSCRLSQRLWKLNFGP